MEKQIEAFQAVGDLIGIGSDTPETLQKTQAGSNASFPLLADLEMAVTPLYDMQLRPDWPMGGMGNIPEMGYVIVDPQGKIHLQRVDLYFGDNAEQMLAVLREAAEQ